MAKRKAVSTLVAFVLTVLLISVAITIALTVIKPAFDRMSDSGVINEATQNLELINSAIKQVTSEPGGKRTIAITVTDGEYGINTTNNYIYADYETKTDFSPQGIIGDVRLDKSPVFIEYFNNYVENSNASPPWTIKNGTWTITSGEYSGQNGLAYYNFGNASYFSLEGRITNEAGTNGEIFALPVDPSNLMGYWTFDEGSGNYSYDYSGFNNTGTLFNGGTTWKSGSNCKFGNCLSLDGINGRVNTSAISSFSNTALTISYWVTGPAQSSKEMLSDYSHIPNMFEEWTTGASFSTYVYGTGAIYRDCSVTVLDNTWHFITTVYDGNNKLLDIYVDGVLRDGTLHGTIPATMNTGTTPVDIGAYYTGSGYAGYFNGTIDEIMIFNRSLTAAEVNALYETSYKKLSSTGRTDSVSTSTNVYLVLANPNGNTNFDEVKIKTNKRMMRLSIPYWDIDLNGTARFSKGNYQLTIENKGFNTTVNKPIIELTVA